MTKIASLTGAATVVHPDHGSFDVGDDGMFDVSPELAAELLRFSTQWALEHVALDDSERIELFDLYDPDLILQAVAQWRGRVAELEALPAAERPSAPAWALDPTTLAWCSAVIRDDRAALRQLAELRVEVDRLTAGATKPPAHGQAEGEADAGLEGDSSPASIPAKGTAK